MRRAVQARDLSLVVTPLRNEIEDRQRGVVEPQPAEASRRVAQQCCDQAAQDGVMPNQQHCVVAVNRMTSQQCVDFVRERIAKGMALEEIVSERSYNDPAIYCATVEAVAEKREEGLDPDEAIRCLWMLLVGI